MVLVFCVFWSIGNPYSRYIMGVHSLDQIVYGMSMGIWTALVMHFLVRDNLIQHIE